MEIKDSGKREDFSTGSVRDSGEGKGAYELLPTRALKRLAVHFENGAKKYSSRNWEKGQPLSRFLQSAIRHAFNFLEGDRSEDHAIAAAWNLMCLVEIQERIARGLLPQELDDLSNIPSAQEYREKLEKTLEEAFAKNIKDDYYYLKDGDKVEEGDEYDNPANHGWRKVLDWNYIFSPGLKYPHRRKL